MIIVVASCDGKYLQQKQQQQPLPVPTGNQRILKNVHGPVNSFQGHYKYLRNRSPMQKNYGKNDVFRQAFPHPNPSFFYNTNHIKPLPKPPPLLPPLHLYNKIPSYGK